MIKRPLQVLLVHDAPGSAGAVGRVRRSLAAARDPAFDILEAGRLPEALSILDDGPCDVVLIDVGAADDRSVQNVARLHEHAPDVPIVVLGVGSGAAGVRALRVGSQDYLLRGEETTDRLSRSIIHAIERHQFRVAIRSMALFDELTGLYNRRGFLMLSEQQMKVAQRTGSRLLLLFADMDGMKQINDSFGHLEGDRALTEAAEVLGRTFRDSDIVARIGGDEFVVLALATERTSPDVLRVRLREEVRARNGKNDQRYALRMSIGIASYDPDRPCTIMDLIARADELMYREKNAKQTRTVAGSG